MHRFLGVDFPIPLPKPDVTLSMSSGFPLGIFFLAMTVLGLMAFQTQGFQVLEAMRFHPFSVVNSKILRCSTSDTSVVISHLGSKLAFRHFQRLVSSFSTIRCPDGTGVEAFIWSYFAHRIVYRGGYVLEDVGMRKAILTLLEVSLSFQFFPSRQPLIRYQGLIALLDLGAPAGPIVDDLGFGGNQVVFSAALVLA